MKRSLFSLILLIVVSNISIGQHYDSKWLLASPYDGIHDDECIQLDFNSNPSIMSFRKTPVHFEDNSIAISDEKDKILFYTNGCDILDSNDSVILSKDSLELGKYALDYCYDGHPSSQNIIVLPFLEDSSYYFFYKDVVLQNPNALATKFMYGKIIQSSNGVLEIKELNKKFIHKPLTLGHISATKHENLKQW